MLSGVSEVVWAIASGLYGKPRWSRRLEDPHVRPDLATPRRNGALVGSRKVNRLEGTGTLQAWGGSSETPVQFYFDVTRTELARHPASPTQMRTNAVGKSGPLA